MKEIIISLNKRYTIKDVCLVAGNKAMVIVEKDVLENVKKNFLAIKKIEERKVYGLTTGIGNLCSKSPTISNNDFQKNILLSHACGTSDYLPQKTVRAILFSRLVQLSRGMSGVSNDTIVFLAELLNKNVIPLVKSRGSLGASDLTILAELFVLICNRGKVLYQNKIYSPFEAFKKAAVSFPKELKTREGLALINGNDGSIGIASLLIEKLEKYTNFSLQIACISLITRGGTTAIYNQNFKSSRGQQKALAAVKKLLIPTNQLSTAYQNINILLLQDPPAYKTIIQLYGTAFDVIANAKKIIHTELNEVTDNPLCITDNAIIKFVSSGNYFCASLSLALDQLVLLLSGLTAASIARMQILIDPKYNEHLPEYLLTDTVNNTGFMILLYSAQSLQSEIKALTYPRSNFSLSVANGWENISTNACNAALNLEQVIKLSQEVFLLEAPLTFQALYLRKRQKNITVNKTTSLFITSIESTLREKNVILPIQNDTQISDYLRTMKEVFYEI